MSFTFTLNPQNKEVVKRSFIATNPGNAAGFHKTVLLTPKNSRCSFVYQINTYNDKYFVTIKHKECNSIECTVDFSELNNDTLTVDKAEVFKNCSPYPCRTETAEKFLRKYDQIACIVYGALKADLLYNVQEPKKELIPDNKQLSLFDLYNIG